MPASYTAVMEAPRTAGSFKTVRHNARLKRRWTLRCIRRLRIFSPAAQKTPSPDGRAEECRTPAGGAAVSTPYRAEHMRRPTHPPPAQTLRRRRRRIRRLCGGRQPAPQPHRARQTRQTRHSRRFKSTRRDQRHDTIPSESRRAFLHRFSSARRRYAGRLRGYAAHPLRSGGLRAVPRRRVGRRGGGARALFPAGADGHALRPAGCGSGTRKAAEIARCAFCCAAFASGRRRPASRCSACCCRPAGCSRGCPSCCRTGASASRCCCRCCSSSSFPRGCRRFGRSAG